MIRLRRNSSWFRAPVRIGLCFSPALCSIAILLICSGLSFSSCSLGRGAPADELRRQLRANEDDIAVRAKLVEQLASNGNYPEAVSVGEEGLPQHPDDIALLKALGMAHTYWAAYGGSNDHRQPAERYLRKLIDLGAADSMAFGRLGWIQNANGKKDDALKSYETAVNLAPDDARALGQLGYASTQMGKYEKAIPLLQKAAAKPAQPTDLGQAPAWVWRWLGDAQRLSGDYPSAVTAFEKAYNLAPKAEKKEYKDYVDYTRSLTLETPSWEAYRAHLGLAERHRGNGRHDRAVSEYELAMTSAPESPEREANGARGWVHSNLAYEFRVTGQRDQALAHALKAITFHEKAGNTEQLGYAYECLANVYAHMTYGARENLAALPEDVEHEYWDKALAASEAAEKVYASAGLTKSAQSAHVQSTYFLGARYEGKDPRFKEMRQTNLERLPAEGPITDSAQVNLALNECTYREVEENYEGSLKLLFRLLKHYDSLTSESTEVDAEQFYNMMAAGYLLQRKDVDTGLMYLEKALAVAEVLRNRLGSDKFKRGADSYNFEVTSQGLVFWNTQKGDFAKAFDYSESYKGRALLDLLNPESISRKREVIVRREVQERQQLARVEDLKKEFSAAQSGGDEATVRGIERNLSIEQTNYQRLKEDVSAAKIEIASIDSANVAQWKDIQPLLKGITLVSYVTHMKDQNSVIVASEDGVVGVRIADLNGNQVRRWLTTFRSDLRTTTGVGRDLNVEQAEKAKGTDEKAHPKETVQEASRKLHEILIEPILPYLKTEIVYISPDSLWNYLPFEALRDKDGRYLIESHAIAYTPSANVLKLCMEKERHRKDSMLAFGNPNLLNPQFRLANAEEEVTGLRGLFPKADIYSFDNATETAFKKHAADYDILHFACHGELNPDDPMLTALRLAPDAENDGYLHAGEVFDMNLSASLVVLSSCNSALGELSTGNELMGLTRSFLYAGAPSIIASLWTVDDRSTAFLMEQFYKNLGTMNKAEALRQAKLATMKQYPSPFHWAPFCLQGDYR